MQKNLKINFLYFILLSFYKKLYFYTSIYFIKMKQIIHNSFIVKQIDIIPTESVDSLRKSKSQVSSKVSRIFAISTHGKLEIFLDVNTEIYSLCLEDKLDIMLLTILQPEKTVCKTDTVENFFEKELIDLYEYVVYGIIFHIALEKNKFFIYASFGGLLMKLFGLTKIEFFSQLEVDSKILLLIRKK